jgi:hypothetical protein
LEEDERHLLQTDANGDIRNDDIMWLDSSRYFDEECMTEETFIVDGIVRLENTAATAEALKVVTNTETMMSGQRLASDNVCRVLLFLSLSLQCG